MRGTLHPSTSHKAFYKDYSGNVSVDQSHENFDVRRQSPAAKLRSSSSAYFDAKKGATPLLKSKTMRPDVYAKQRVTTQIKTIADNVFNNISQIDQHVDSTDQKYLKYYDSSKLKDKLGIQSTLSHDNAFYSGGPRVDQPPGILKRTRNSMPFFPEIDYFMKMSRSKPNTPNPNSKTRGIKVLDLNLNPAPDQLVQSSSMISRGSNQRREHLKIELESMFDRKYSAPVNIADISAVNHEIVLPSAVTSAKSSMLLASTPIEQLNPGSLNSRKRKEIMDEIMHKKNTSIEAVQGIYKRVDPPDQMTISKGKLQSWQKKKDFSSRKAGDNVYYQLMAMSKEQRERVREKIKTAVPSTPKYSHFFNE